MYILYTPDLPPLLGMIFIELMDYVPKKFFSMISVCSVSVGIKLAYSLSTLFQIHCLIHMYPKKTNQRQGQKVCLRVLGDRLFYTPIIFFIF